MTKYVIRKKFDNDDKFFYNEDTGWMKDSYDSTKFEFMTIAVATAELKLMLDYATYDVVPVFVERR